jgi:signal transduction histidine kinase
VFQIAPAAADSRELCFDSLDLIQRTSVRIHHRVKEIADCVKGRSTPPSFAPCSIAAIVRDVFETLKLLASEKHAVLAESGLDELPPLLADERRLYTAIYNLVINAIPEVPAGGRIEVAGRAEGDTLVLEVRDDGRGMSKEAREALFSVGTVSLKTDGTGLGTKIVKDVVDAHGGTIAVDSELGRGTTFVLRLPLHPKGAP